jgi:hypothetical protein
MPEDENQASTPTADDVIEMAVFDRESREGTVPEVRVVEEESAGTLQAESLRAHEDGADVGIDDELPGGDGR